MLFYSGCFKHESEVNWLLEEKTSGTPIIRYGVLCLILAGIIYIYYASTRTTELEISEMNVVISAEDISDKDNAKGVRDYVWCMDGTNILETSKGKVGYFNVFIQDEIGPRIYRGICDNGKYEATPIALSRDVGIDDLGISIGSVIYKNGVYQLFYAGLTAIEGKPRYYTYNIAYSNDGLNFSGKKTLLTNDYFDSMHIGLPYTLALEGANSSFLMVFESIDVKTNQYCVYGAYGTEESFSAINDGHPIITGKDIPWPEKIGGVANPKLKKGTDGKYYLGFNAAYLAENKSAWRLGTATFSFNAGEVTDLKVDKPIIMPYGEDMKRIESTEIIYDSHMNPLEITFFATPTYDATLGATIYRGVFKKN